MYVQNVSLQSLCTLHLLVTVRTMYDLYFSLILTGVFSIILHFTGGTFLFGEVKLHSMISSSMVVTKDLVKEDLSTFLTIKLFAVSDFSFLWQKLRPQV